RRLTARSYAPCSRRHLGTICSAGLRPPSVNAFVIANARVAIGTPIARRVAMPSNQPIATSASIKLERSRSTFVIVMLVGLVACGKSDRVAEHEAALDVHDYILPTEGVGTLPGELEVGADGAAIYTVPLALPPGRHGVAPVLSITYNSNGGDGILGPGFTISGLSAISRCAPSINLDGMNGAVVLSERDRLCLDGQRLEPEVNGADYWSAGTYIIRDNPLIRVYAVTDSTVTGIH